MGELGSGTGSSYPTTLDTNATVEVNSPNPGKTKARAEVPNDHASALIKIETELGTLPKGSKADVKTRLDDIETTADDAIPERNSLFDNINHMDIRLLPIGPELNELQQDIDDVQTNLDKVESDNIVIQIVNTNTGAVATGTTVVVLDDSIPQNGEGDEYMTLAITPTSTVNDLRIEVTLVMSHDAATSNHIISLFRDAQTDALASVVGFGSTGGELKTYSFSWYEVSGASTSTTYKVRAGAVESGETTFNGQAGARKLGGAMSSSITITELVP